MTRKPHVAIVRATPQLRDLATAVRPDWAQDDIQAAIAAATVIGHTWEQVLTGLTRLMVDPKAHPRELVPHPRGVLPTIPAAGPTDEYRAARHALEGEAS